MRRGPLILSVLVAASPVARADLSREVYSSDQFVTAGPSVGSLPQSLPAAMDWVAPLSDVPADLKGWAAAEPSTTVVSPVLCPSGLLDGSRASGAAHGITQLPPAPSSDILCLTGLLSMGALQLLRRAQCNILFHVPEWYRAACPQRIGHIVPFDFDLSVLPLRAFESTPNDADQRSALAYRISREFCPRFCPQAILLIAAPRGPPVRC